MSSADILRSALRDAGLDAPVVFDEVTESTNRTAMALAERGTPDWTLVGAGHQTAGRGRLGRAWASRPGSSVLFSVVLRPRIAPPGAAVLSLAAGAAAAEAATRASSAVVGCKWPNDLVSDEGKVGGILLESAVSSAELQHVVVGIGLNLEPPPDVDGAAGLGSADVHALVAAFLVRLRDLVVGEDPIHERVLSAYRPLCATIGRTVRATTLTGEVVQGVAEDLDAEGSLLVRAADELRPVAFGEVEHLRDG